MKKITLLLLSLTVLFSSTSTLLAAPSTINAVTEEWEDCTNADGTGLYWELLKLVYEPEGIAFTHECVPYARAQKLVVSGKKDVIAGPYKGEMSTGIYGSPFFDQDIVVAVYKPSRQGEWNGEESIANKNVAWIRGYGYDDYLTVKPNFTEVNDSKMGLTMVANDRFDYYLDAQLQLDQELEKGYVDASTLEKQVILKLNLFMVFSPTQKGKELAEIYERRMNELIDNGELKKLYDKWGFDWPF